jgi:outer membrane protein OmpU
MKKILLATTVLAFSAGIASAEITFGGSAAAGIAKNGISNCVLADCGDPNGTGLADDKFLTYSSFSLDVTASGQTDSGLSFGASSGISAGRSYGMADDDGFDVGGATLDNASIFVSGSFGKVTFNSDGIDGYDTDAANFDGVGDVKYEGTFGGFGVGLVADVDTGTASVMGSYTLAGIALSADYTQDDLGPEDLWNVSAGYTMGAITGTLHAANDDGAANDVAADVTLAYAANGISASATYHADATATFDVEAGYAMGAYAVNFEASDVTEAAGTMSWTVTGSYDLGGGLSLEAGTNYTGDIMVGAAMSF